MVAVHRFQSSALFCLYGTRQTRDWTIFFVRGSGPAVFPGTGCSHDGIQRDFLYVIRPPRDSPGRMQPPRDSTGFLYRSYTRAAAEPARVATGKPSGSAGPTPTNSWPEVGAGCYGVVLDVDGWKHQLNVRTRTHVRPLFQQQKISSA